MTKRPVWIEVNLKNIQRNIKKIGAYLPWHTEIMAVVKQNAYGHGIVEVAGALSDIGIDHFGVASIEEALLLRNKGIPGTIYVLGCILPSQIRYIIEHQLRIFITGSHIAYVLNREAARSRRLVPVHVKVDTGMGRIGVWYKEAEKFIEYVRSRRNLYIEGIATHLPSADCDDAFTRRQIKRLHSVVADARGKNISVPLVHCANSIAALRFKQAHFNMVRVGLLMYGMNPAEKFNVVKKLSLQPALSLKAKIVFLKSVAKGTSVSYARAYVAASRRKIGTVACGYADGYPWRLNKGAYTIVKGSRAPITGRVCMDQLMIDVSNVAGIRCEDEVTLIGGNAAQRIRAEDVARWSSTIPYQITTCLSATVRRVFIS